MNILVVSNSNWNLFNFRIGFIKYLASNHNVFIILSKNESQYNFGKNITELKIDGLERNRLNIVQIIRFIYQTNAHINDEDIDVVFSFTFYISSLLSLIRLCNTKNKFELRSVITGLGKLYTSKTFKNRILFFIGILFLKYSEIIFTQNHFDKHYLNKYLDIKKIRVIPGSGIDIDKFSARPTFKGDVIKFCYVGRLLKSKGVDIIVEAFNEFSKSFNAELLIIGDYDSNDKSFRLNNMSKNISHLGWTEETKIYFEECHASVLMSDREGLSKSLLESMSCSTPIIAYGAPGVIDIFDSAKDKIGICVEDRSSTALYSAMLKFAGLSDIEYLDMCSYSRDLIVTNYTSQIVNKKLQEI